MRITPGARGRSGDRKCEKNPPHERGNPRRLWSGRHKGRDRRWGAFVNVRRPNVERYSRDLEAKTDQHHRGARQYQGRIKRVIEPRGDLGYVCSARECFGCGTSINEGNTVEQKCGSK